MRIFGKRKIPLILCGSLNLLLTAECTIGYSAVEVVLPDRFYHPGFHSNHSTLHQVFLRNGGATANEIVMEEPQVLDF